MSRKHLLFLLHYSPTEVHFLHSHMPTTPNFWFLIKKTLLYVTTLQPTLQHDQTTFSLPPYNVPPLNNTIHISTTKTRSTNFPLLNQRSTVHAGHHLQLSYATFQQITPCYCSREKPLQITIRPHLLFITFMWPTSYLKLFHNHHQQFCSTTTRPITTSNTKPPHIKPHPNTNHIHSRIATTSTITTQQRVTTTRSENMFASFSVFWFDSSFRVVCACCCIYTFEFCIFCYDVKLCISISVVISLEYMSVGCDLYVYAYDYSITMSIWFVHFLLCCIIIMCKLDLNNLYILRNLIMDSTLSFC